MIAHSACTVYVQIHTIRTQRLWRAVAIPAASLQRTLALARHASSHRDGAPCWLQLCVATADRFAADSPQGDLGRDRRAQRRQELEGGEAATSPRGQHFPEVQRSARPPPVPVPSEWGEAREGNQGGGSLPREEVA